MVVHRPLVGESLDHPGTVGLDSGPLAGRQSKEGRQIQAMALHVHRVATVILAVAAAAITSASNASSTLTVKPPPFASRAGARPVNLAPTTKTALTINPFAIHSGADAFNVCATRSVLTPNALETSVANRKGATIRLTAPLVYAVKAAGASSAKSRSIVALHEGA